MGKKKFIDKKKSATFQLLARDSSDPNFSGSPGADCVFVRVDSNPVSAAFIAADDDLDCIFDDAPEVATLSEDVRKEILELGFPDDGYNYLMHLREIKNAGGGSFYYENPKFRADDIPHDVKAYDASRLQISELDGEPEEKIMYSVASKTSSVRVQKAVDPEVAALLDDSDLSRFGSDIEDLEEDFVVQANLHEDGDDEDEETTHISEEAVINIKQNNEQGLQLSTHATVIDDIGKAVDCVDEKPRARRLLDEQFDLLELKEYGSDVDNDAYYNEHYGAEEDNLAEKLKLSLNKHVLDDIEPDGDKYKVPADLLKNKEASMSGEEEVCAADVILRRCKEYGEGYEVEDEDKDVVLVEETCDESEVWDCETIVSTYSNLDNHPGKIGAPEGYRKKLSEMVSAAVSSPSQIITLGGKEKLPVDFLPGNRKPPSGKVKGQSNANTEQYKRKQHGQESKEEKKERKAAVKEERREARCIKKEMKGLYRGEARRAQRTVAVSGPSTIHLM